MFVTFTVSFIFGGAGHGSFAPMSIFYSWARLFLEYGILPETSFWSDILLLVIYPLSIFIAATLLLRNGKPRWYFVVLSFHVLGIILSALIVEHGHLVTKQTIMASYAAAIPIAFGYYFIDYRLLKRSRLMTYK